MFLEGAWTWGPMHIALASIAAVFIVSVLVFTVLYCVNTYYQKKQMSSLEMNTSNVCIYIYNLDDRTIRYFEKQNMSDQRVTTDEAYFASFPDRADAQKVQNWVYSYAYDSSPASFLTVKAYDAKGRECLSIYRITSFDRKKNIIHFEKTLLPKISSKKSYFLSQDKNSYVKKIEDVEAYACKGKKPRSCVCYYITMAPLINIADGNSKDRSLTVTQRSLYVTSIYQPLNNVQHYLSKKRNLVLISDKEAAIFDFSSTYRTDIISFCNTVLNEIQRYFAVKDLSSIYEISIGVDVYESNGLASFNRTIRRAKSLANKAALKDNVSYLIEGEEGSDTPSFDAEQIDKEISALVKNATFRSYFTPIISSSLDIPYYLVDIRPYGTSYSDLSSLLEASEKIGKAEPLLEVVFAYITSLMRGDEGVAIINLPFIFDEKAITMAYKKVLGASKHIMIGLDKDNIQGLYDADIDVEAAFSDLNKQGISLCLDCLDGDVDSPASILAYFSCFLVTFLTESPLHGNERKISQLISCSSVLKAQKKPVIVSGIMSQADIALGKELGYTAFVSPQLAPASSVPYDWKNVVKFEEGTRLLPVENTDTGYISPADDIGDTSELDSYRKIMPRS